MTTTTPLSPSVSAYLDLASSDDKTPAAELFSLDAVVRDNDDVRSGRDAIRSWLAGSASEYTYTSTLLSSEETDGVALLSMLLEGDFPGGRVELHYRFELAADGLIESLTISV